MSQTMIHRPQETDLSDPVYHLRYVNQVDGPEALPALTSQKEALLRLFDKLAEEQSGLRYEVGKWSIKEVLGHMIDTERIMSYRAMSIARGEKQSLPGFDENAYAEAASFANRSLLSLRQEYQGLREANMALFSSFDDLTLSRAGTANGRPITVRGLVWLVAGHEKHHLNILQERYLPLLNRE